MRGASAWLPKLTLRFSNFLNAASPPTDTIVASHRQAESADPDGA
jgi:hypothetical protein